MPSFSLLMQRLLFLCELAVRVIALLAKCILSSEPFNSKVIIPIKGLDLWIFSFQLSDSQQCICIAHRTCADNKPVSISIA